MFFDYRITTALPEKYQTFGLKIGKRDTTTKDNQMRSKKIQVDYPHLKTEGYLSRIVYWDGTDYCEERV